MSAWTIAVFILLGYIAMRAKINGAYLRDLTLQMQDLKEQISLHESSDTDHYRETVELHDDLNQLARRFSEIYGEDKT